MPRPLVAASAGSKLANTWLVGQIPGQPSGLLAPSPTPVGFEAPPGLFDGNVPGANTYRPVACEPAPSCCTASASKPSADAPVTPPGLSSGPNASEVPAPDSNARLFIGCFEYSYDSIPDE